MTTCISILRGINVNGQKINKVRVQIENNLHRELLIEIATVQDKIARQKIDEFKKKHIIKFLKLFFPTFVL